MNRQRSIVMLIVLLAGAPMAGCRDATSAPPRGPQIVTYDLPVTRTVTDFAEFPGHTEAIYDIEVRARVSGYMTKVCFKDGDFVKEGQVLFDIDPRQYKAELDRATGNVGQIEAHLWRVEKEYHRAKGLLARNSISQEECDRYEADWKETAANLQLAKGNRDLAQLNYDWCEVKASITGLCSRRMVDPGNLVKADDTILTSIVSLDPMYVYFTVDEQTMLKVLRLLKTGTIKARSAQEVPVKIGLSDEAPDAFVHEGMVDFTDNHVDVQTGTLQFRAKLANPDHFIAPNLFVRVRLQIGDPHPAVMIPERALVKDQGINRVWVVKQAVDKEGKPAFQEIARRGSDESGKPTTTKVKMPLCEPLPVKIGELGVLVDGYREIGGGIKTSDWVVVSGMQRLHEKVQVAVDRFETKSDSPPASADSANQKDERAVSAGGAPATTTPAAAPPRVVRPGTEAAVASRAGESNSPSNTPGEPSAATTPPKDLPRTQ